MKDFENKLLFDFGSREREMKNQKKIGLPEINFFDLNLEEDRDKEQVELLLHRYNKALRALFNKYSFTGKKFINS